MKIIELSEAAKEAIIAYRKILDVPVNHYLRVGISQKNASDKQLLIGFDIKTEKDKLAECDGITIIYNPGQAIFFAGMIIDFDERDGKKGFVLK